MNPIHYNIAYNIAIANIKGCRDEHTKKEIRLLLDQFYYGIEAKKDLYRKCIELGWVKV